jgi:hypothetical protein
LYSGGQRTSVVFTPNVTFKINELQGLKKEKGDTFSEISHLVHNVLQLSNLFLKDLEKLRGFQSALVIKA